MESKTFLQPNPESWVKTFRFFTPIRVRYCETDLLGHVNNVSYFMYFEQGRIEYIEHLGITDQLFGEDRMTVVADLQCTYLKPLYLRDPIQLGVRVAKLGRSSIDVEYALMVNDELRAAGRGTIVLVDKKTGRSTAIPNHLREIIQAFEGKHLQ